MLYRLPCPKNTEAELASKLVDGLGRKLSLFCASVKKTTSNKLIMLPLTSILILSNLKRYQACNSVIPYAGIFHDSRPLFAPAKSNGSKFAYWLLK